MSQLALDFEPGLTARFAEWEDVLAAAVYGSRKGLNGIAGDLDMSPSELCRRLNRNADDARPLRAQDAMKIIAATEDFRPVYWQIEKFLRDPETTRNQAIQQLAQVMPIVQALIEQAGQQQAKAKR